MNNPCKICGQVDENASFIATNEDEFKKIVDGRSINPKDVEINYTNWKGNISIRVIRPLQMWFGSTEFHPENQWLIEAWDYGKKDTRTFAVKDIHHWEQINRE